jgi:hypothetical protein
MRFRLQHMPHYLVSSVRLSAVRIAKAIQVVVTDHAGLYVLIGLDVQ